MPDVETLIAQFEADQRARLAAFVAQLRAATAAGEPPVLAASRFTERDRLVLDCWGRFFAGGSVRQGSEAMAAALARYSATGWVRDRTATDCPRRGDTPENAFWAILRTVPRTLSAERIRKVMGQI